MFAVTTTGSLTLLNSASLKKSSISTSTSLEFQPSTTCWSTDNTVLYLASNNTISRYHHSQNFLEEIFSTEDSPITRIISKDKSTLIFSVAETIHFLESCTMTTTPKLSSQKSNMSHKSSINSLSISNDNTLLLSASSSTVHVHNLTHSNTNPTTTLRGLPSPNQIATALFHAHIRTRVLVGVGKQLLVYDTTRPSAPLKTFTMEGEGEVEMIAFSPFSKTLVAVAMGGAGAGTIGLVDLEKEKGLFRTIDTKVPITALSFSPEGASIYAGTETGKLLVIDLRALDKPPSVVEISGEGSGGGHVVAISIQKKNPGTPVSAPRKPSTTSATTTSPTVRRPVSASKSNGTPAAKRTVSFSRTVAVNVGKSGAPTLSSPTVPSIKKVFSPARSPLANSSNRKSRPEGEEDFSGTIRRGNPPSPLAAISVAKKEKEKNKLSSTGTLPPTSRTRTISSISKASVAASAAGGVRMGAKVSMPVTSTSRTSPKNSTTTTINPTSRATTSTMTAGESISTAGSHRPRMKTTGPGGRSGSSSDSVPPVPTLPKGLVVSTVDIGGAKTERRDRTRTRTRTGTLSTTDTKTPSPDLPSLRDSGNISDSEHEHEVPGEGHLPVTPGPAAKKGLGFRGLGLGVPGRGHGSGTHDKDDGSGNRGGVDDFFDEDEDGRGVEVSSEKEEDQLEDEEEEETSEREGDLSMQISPARRPTAKGQAPLPSDRHHSHHVFDTYNPNGNQSPQTFLRSIIHNVLSDFQLQTHQEMTDLHLDLVRIRRGWKDDVREVVREEIRGVVDRVGMEVREGLDAGIRREIRDGVFPSSTTVMRQGDSDLREMKEEIRMLREENANLRRVVAATSGTGSSGSGSA